MLHSLVRVSRRVGCSHSGTNNCSARCDRPPARTRLRRQTLHAVATPTPNRDGGGPAPPFQPCGEEREGPRCPCEDSQDLELSSVAPGPINAVTTGYKFSAKNVELPAPSPSSARRNCCWPAPRRSAEWSAAQTDRPPEPFYGLPGSAAGPTRRLLSLTGSYFSCIRFPPNGFAVFLTLFSKYFSPFPHGTCSLSVSCRYLALDGVYHPLWAAFPNNPTLRRQ